MIRNVIEFDIGYIPAHTLNNLENVLESIRQEIDCPDLKIEKTTPFKVLLSANDDMDLTSAMQILIGQKEMDYSSFKKKYHYNITRKSVDLSEIPLPKYIGEKFKKLYVVIDPDNYIDYKTDPINEIKQDDIIGYSYDIDAEYKFVDVHLKYKIRLGFDGTLHFSEKNIFTTREEAEARVQEIVSKKVKKLQEKLDHYNEFIKEKN